MEILYLLIPLSLVLAFAIGATFLWAMRSDQFEDLEGPGWSVVMDDDRPDSAPGVSASTHAAGAGAAASVSEGTAAASPCTSRPA